MAISGPPEAVAEGSDAVFTATLSNLVSGEVTAEWYGQSAASGDNAEMSDYGSVYGPSGYPRGSFTIPANTLTHTFTVPVNDDNLAEPAEVFSIVIGVISAPGFASDTISSDTMSGGARAFATIAASDSITVNLSGPGGVFEGRTTRAYTVSLSGGAPTANLTVNFATADGTAEAGSDYTSQSGTLTFTPDDHADKTFTVQTASDTLEEGDETFTVAPESATGGGGPAPVLGTSSVTTTIRNLAVPPGQPAGLSAQLDDAVTGLSLTWDAPADGGAPTGYQILRRAPATETDLIVIADDTGSTDTAFTDTTATPRTKYVYRVKARNAAGLGQISLPAYVTTQNRGAQNRRAEALRQSSDKGATRPDLAQGAIAVEGLPAATTGSAYG